MSKLPLSHLLQREQQQTTTSLLSRYPASITRITGITSIIRIASIIAAVVVVTNTVMGKPLGLGRLRFRGSGSPIHARVDSYGCGVVGSGERGLVGGVEMREEIVKGLHGFMALGYLLDEDITSGESII